MINIELKEKAGELIKFRGKTQEEVANLLNISVRTIANWCGSENWIEKRKEYLRMIEDLTLQTLKLLNAATEKALKTQDNQDIYAVIQLHACIGNPNNQFYHIRPLIIKDLIDIKKISFDEVSRLLSLKVERVKKIYMKAKNAN